MAPEPSSLHKALNPLFSQGPFNIKKQVKFVLNVIIQPPVTDLYPVCSEVVSDLVFQLLIWSTTLQVVFGFQKRILLGQDLREVKTAGILESQYIIHQNMVDNVIAAGLLPNHKHSYEVRATYWPDPKAAFGKWICFKGSIDLGTQKGYINMEVKTASYYDMPPPDFWAMTAPVMWGQFLIIYSSTLRKLAQTKTEYVFTQCSTPCHQY
jgi:hypothetical protein